MTSAFHLRLMSDVGRGIVAARNIEVSPVLVMPLEDLGAVKSTALNHYT